MRENTNKKTTQPSQEASKGFPIMSARRVKEMAKRLRPLVAKAQGAPDEQQCLDWAAVALGFKDFQEVVEHSTLRERPHFDIKAGTHKKPQGGFLGMGGSKPDWVLSERMMLGHELILGSTGAGKTEALLSRADLLMEANPAMGMIHVDGKADMSIFRRFWAMCRFHGRAHELRMVNFMWRAHQSYEEGEVKRTHSYDPVERFDASMLARWLDLTFSDAAKALPQVSGEARAPELLQAIFMGIGAARADLLRAGLLAPGLSGVLACLDKEVQALPAVRKALGNLAMASFARCESLVGDPASASEFSGPLSGLRSARAAIESLVSSTLSAWIKAYPEMLGAKKGVGGEWLRAEVSAFSCFEGEIVLVGLPALEKSPDELAILGRSVMGAFAVAQSSMAEAWPRRMQCRAVFDEFGYYACNDIAAMLEEAKRVGSSIVFSSQDLHAATGGIRRSKAHRDAVLGVLSGLQVKSFMKCEDSDPWSMRFILDSMHGEAKSPGVGDLREQREGESWVAGGGACGQVDMAYINRTLAHGESMVLEVVPPRPMNLGALP